MDEGNRHDAGEPPALHYSSRGYLPHFDSEGLFQAVTFRLADSMPRVIACYGGQRNQLHDALDGGLGSCWLSNPQVASLVEECLCRFDGVRYRLMAWVIMPNHVHVVVETYAGFPVRRIVQTWKSYSAKAANRHLHRHGRF